MTKSIEWLGDSLEMIQGFCRPVKIALGSDLQLLQKGEKPLHARPMKIVGRGVWELRAKDGTGQFRLLYVVKHGSRIYVLHAFQKKTQKTRKSDIDLGRSRLKEIK